MSYPKAKVCYYLVKVSVVYHSCFIDDCTSLTCNSRDEKILRTSSTKGGICTFIMHSHNTFFLQMLTTT